MLRKPTIRAGSNARTFRMKNRNNQVNKIRTFVLAVVKRVRNEFKSLLTVQAFHKCNDGTDLLLRQIEPLG